MPTTKPRHAITETDEVSEALEVAGRRWPEDRDRPAVLLRHLIEEGRRRIEPEVAGERAGRAAALRRASGALTGVYEPGYLETLRAEWPE